MRKMTDTASDKVMLPVIQHKRNRFQRSRERGKFLCDSGRKVFPRRNDIVSVFDQMRFGILITCLFRPSHWMTADKLSGKSEGFDFFVNVSLGAAHVRQQTGFWQKGLKFFKITGVGGYGSAKIDKIAGSKLLIYGLTGQIYVAFPNSFFQCVTASHVGHDTNLRVVHFNRLGDGTADQSQAYKSNTFYLHSNTPFQPYLLSF